VPAVGHQPGHAAESAVPPGDGAGRVCYTALGHDSRAWGNPWFRQLVRQSVLWAAGVPDDDIATWSTRWPLGNGRQIR